MIPALGRQIFVSSRPEREREGGGGKGGKRERGEVGKREREREHNQIKGAEELAQL